MKIKVLILLLFSFTLAPAQITIHVDFNKSMDYPLSKNKIGGLYQTPWLSAERIERDIPKIAELESRSMRYEIAWGQRSFGNEMVTRDGDGSLHFDFPPWIYSLD